MMGRRIVWGIVAVGLAVTALGCRMLQRKMEQIATWPTVEAKLTRIWISEQSGEDGPEYLVNYEFTYDFRDWIYHSKFNPGDVYTRADAERKMALRPIGTVAAIRVNPQKADEIDPNLGRNGGSLAASLWVIVAGAGMALMAAPWYLVATSGDNW